MDTVPLMLLALHMLALGIVAIIFVVMIVLHRRARALQRLEQTRSSASSQKPESRLRPSTWLAVRASNTKAVQAALGVNCPAPCPWSEGIAGEHEFFIAPPRDNWIIVTGSNLPQPARNVDRCFHFLIHLSRVLGHIQFFLADDISNHHAWVRVENGIVRRAYVWTGQTMWNQGTKSLAEMELNVKCFGYGEDSGTDIATRESAAANVKMVPSLAMRWGIDPLAVEGDFRGHVNGIAGKSSLFCQD